MRQQPQPATEVHPGNNSSRNSSSSSCSGSRNCNRAPLACLPSTASSKQPPCSMAPAYAQQRMRLRSKCKMPPDTPHAEPDCKRRRTEANADAKQGSVTQSKDPPAEAPPVSMSGMANPTCISVRARDPLDVTGRGHTDGGSWWAVSRPRERLYRPTRH